MLCQCLFMFVFSCSCLMNGIFEAFYIEYDYSVAGNACLLSIYFVECSLGGNFDFKFVFL